jgi:LPS-assembly lipoprotein
MLAAPFRLVQTARMSPFRLNRTVLVAALALLLSACGFHLRAALQLPADLGPVRVAARDPYSPLAESLSMALERAGATAAPEDATTGVATLNIRSERWASVPTAVDQFGRAQEYTLRYAAVFEFTKADGTTFVPQQAVELAHDYISIPTKSSGTESERELLAREMRKEMTASILRRIDAVSRMPQAVGAPPATAQPATDSPLAVPVDSNPADSNPAGSNPVDSSEAPAQPLPLDGSDTPSPSPGTPPTEAAPATPEPATTP